jgi:hypothetical protein
VPLRRKLAISHLQAREDLIDVGLFHTEKRNRIGTTRDDDVYESSLGIFAKNILHLTDWLRVDADIHFHPAEPRTFRVSLTRRF